MEPRVSRLVGSALESVAGPIVYNGTLSCMSFIKMTTLKQLIVQIIQEYSERGVFVEYVQHERALEQPSTGLNSLDVHHLPPGQSHDIGFEA